MNNLSFDAMEAEDDDLLRSDEAPGPMPAFVAQLRMTLRQEARRIEATAPQRTGPAVPEPRPALAPGRRSTAFSRPMRAAMSRATTIAVIVAVLVVAVRSFGDPGGAQLPAAIPASSGATPPSTPSMFADVSTIGGDAARTNVQPGPGLAALPEIAQRSDAAGLAMALADGVLVVTTPSKATALNAETMQVLWTVDLPGGAYSAPTIAAGQIYFGVVRDTEVGSGKTEKNQLVALSLQDGHELWRIDGAGSYPASPIISGKTVYALGVADGRYRAGAYRTEDGSAVWQSDVGPFSWCCPQTGIALGGGTLAVSDADTLSAFDAATGKRLWGRTPENGESVGAPMIVGDEIVVNSGNDPSGTPVVSGATTAYAMQTGDVRWSNSSTRSYSAPLAATANGVLYAGPWGDDGSGRLALLRVGGGEVIWSVPLPRVAGDTNNYVSVEAAPVIVGDTAYVALDTAQDGTATNQSSLVAAVDLANGAVRWMAKVDGGLATAPIVSGGQLFALTFNAGLTVLGDSGQPAAQPGATVDLRRKVACTAAPAQSPMLGSLPATPSIPGVAAWNQPILFSQLPAAGGAVDPTVAAQLTQRFEEYRACSQIDPYGSVYGFFSTDFYVRLLALNESDYNSKAQPWAIWMASMQEYLSLDVNSLTELPDGRIGGLVNSPGQNIYIWWVQENGVWKIDEYHRVSANPVNPIPATPAASPSPAVAVYG